MKPFQGVESASDFRLRNKPRLSLKRARYGTMITSSATSAVALGTRLKFVDRKYNPSERGSFTSFHGNKTKESLAFLCVLRHFRTKYGLVKKEGTPVPLNAVVHHHLGFFLAVFNSIGVYRYTQFFRSASIRDSLVKFIFLMTNTSL